MSGTAKRREEQRQALWNKWIETAGNAVIGSAIRLSKLGGYGEEVYSQCLSLMSAYQDASAIYDANREAIVTPSTRDILEGIYSILSSRLRQFEDSAAESLSAGTPSNPVAEENIGLCKNILAGARTGTGETLRLCAAALDDLSARPVMQSYMDMMTGEWDVMSSIIRIQVNALEASLPFASDDEQVIVNNILTRLRESYQHFGRAVTVLNDVLRGDGAAVSRETEEPSLTFTYGQPFLDALKQEAFAAADKTRLSYIRAEYRLRRMFSDESHLAGDIVALFEKLLAALPGVETLPAEAETQTAILSGVAETIEIKIESMKESAEYFTEAGKQLIKNFSSDRKALTDEELNAFFERAVVLWREKIEAASEPATGASAFFEALENDELLTANNLYHEKRINEYTEKTEKSLLKFKKETLLYEVCTYEEILTHSVSRLRGCELETVKQAVALLDETFAALEVLLKKNNIEVIRPEPHQMFNGRENEVLVAETQDGFNKGEIIKTINSGYKQKDVIILRANVVAAR